MAGCYSILTEMPGSCHSAALCTKGLPKPAHITITDQAGRVIEDDAQATPSSTRSG